MKVIVNRDYDYDYELWRNTSVLNAVMNGSLGKRILRSAQIVSPDIGRNQDRPI
jgi:hypothetical protein